MMKENSPAGSTDRRTIRALQIPADAEKPCAVVTLAVVGVEFSDAIGGGCLDDAFYGTAEAGRFCVYLDEKRADKGLKPNPRLAALAARLGWSQQARDLALAGDALIAGATPDNDDVDVPDSVLVAARHAGLLPTH
jgi:hypothetical protein